MIYYPLSVLVLAGINEVLLISTPNDIKSYERLLGNGNQWGISIEYKIQFEPKGLAEAFILGKDFIGKEQVCLILGDNIFYGDGLAKMVNKYANSLSNKATIFSYTVDRPERYGVIEFDENGKAISIEEKPKTPKSNQAVVGLYFYPNDVIDIVKCIKPSGRGELEITSINQAYLDEDRLYVQALGRGFAWLDTGTHESLLEASQFIETIEKRQGLKIGCIEEAAFERGFITKDQLLKNAHKIKGSSYSNYLFKRFE